MSAIEVATAIAAGAYGIGVIVTAVVAATEFSYEKGMEKIDKEWGVEHDGTAKRRAASMLLGAPVWPALLYRAAVRTVRDAQATLRDEEEA